MFFFCAIVSGNRQEKFADFSSLMVRPCGRGGRERVQGSYSARNRIFRPPALLPRKKGTWSDKEGGKRKEMEQELTATKQASGTAGLTSNRLSWSITASASRSAAEMGSKRSRFQREGDD